MRDSLAILCGNLFERIHKVAIPQKIVRILAAKSELTKRFQESRIPFAVRPERLQKEPEGTKIRCSRFSFLQEDSEASQPCVLELSFERCCQAHRRWVVYQARNGRRMRSATMVSIALLNSIETGDISNFACRTPSN